jgi:hypothetical protein
MSMPSILLKERAQAKDLKSVLGKAAICSSPVYGFHYFLMLVLRTVPRFQMGKPIWHEKMQFIEVLFLLM